MKLGLGRCVLSLLLFQHLLGVLQRLLHLAPSRLHLPQLVPLPLELLPCLLPLLPLLLHPGIGCIQVRFRLHHVGLRLLPLGLLLCHCSRSGLVLQALLLAALPALLRPVCLRLRQGVPVLPSLFVSLGLRLVELRLLLLGPRLQLCEPCGLLLGDQQRLLQLFPLPAVPSPCFLELPPLLLDHGEGYVVVLLGVPDGVAGLRCLAPLALHLQLQPLQVCLILLQLRLLLGQLTLLHLEGLPLPVQVGEGASRGLHDAAGVALAPVLGHHHHQLLDVRNALLDVVDVPAQLGHLRLLLLHPVGQGHCVLPHLQLLFKFVGEQLLQFCQAALQILDRFCVVQHFQREFPTGSPQRPTQGYGRGW